MAWLIIHGRLATAEELARFSRRLTANAQLHEAMKHHFEGFPVNAPPMAITLGDDQHAGMFPHGTFGYGRSTKCSRRSRRS